MPRSAWWRLSVAAGVYAAGAAVATWPMLRAGADHIISRFPGDVLLVTWILSWDAHALLTRPLSLFQGNILHPAPDSLAFSEHLLGQLPTFAPIWLATGNPVLALNATIFLSFILCGLFMHLVLSRWTGSELAAYSGGFAYAFAPWRMSSFHWPHLLTVQYFPLALWALDRTAAAGRARSALLAASLITLQMLCSYYEAYMVAVLLGTYLAVDAMVRGWRRSGREWAALGVSVLVPIVVLAIVSIPYLRTRHEIVTTVVDQTTLATLIAFLGSPRAVAVSVGWGTIVLAACAIVTFAQATLGRRADLLVRLLALALTAGIALAIGPGPAGLLGGRLAPYTWLSGVVPGFSLVRLPARFGILVSFCLSMLAGFGVATMYDLLARHSRGLAAAAGSVAIVVVLFPLGVADRHAAVPILTGGSVPAVYSWLASQGDGGPLLELPVARPGTTAWTEARRVEAMAMYFSTYHWLPLLNGYSGYLPDSYATIMDQAVRLPMPDALAALVACTGLRWILVREATAETRQAWQGQPGVTLKGMFPRGATEDALYEVHLPRGAICPLAMKPTG
jgi:hypothetical protein